MGGIVYLSLSLGGPIAGLLLKNYNNQVILGTAMLGNCIWTLWWSLTPVNWKYSTELFIFLRFVMGLHQCVICVFLPIWTNEYAPTHRRTAYMSYLQASVPIGIMFGYILGALVLEAKVKNNSVCHGILCWRWPIIVEVCLMIPFCIGVFLMPADVFNLNLEQNDVSRS